MRAWCRLLNRLLDDAPRLVLKQLAVGRHKDHLQPALQNLLKRQAIAICLRDLGIAAAHDDRNKLFVTQLSLVLVALLLLVGGGVDVCEDLRDL